MKGRLFAGVMSLAPPPIAPQPSAEPSKKAKPIATIGTMKKGSTPDQIKLHGRMKRDMKRAARNIRHQQLQEADGQAKE